MLRSSLIILFIVSYIFNVLLIKSLNVKGFEDKELNSYVALYFEEAAKRNCDLKYRNLHIYFSKTDGKRKARSIVRWPGLLKSEIIIDIDWYNSAKKWERERVIFHELSHVYLARKHNNSYIYRDSQLIPVSLMNRLGTEYYKNNRDYYLNELFTN